MMPRYLVAAMLAITLCACGNTRLVPVESVRVERVNTDSEAVEKAFSRIIDLLRGSERTADSVRTIERLRIVLNDRGDTLRTDRETDTQRTTTRERQLLRLLSRSDSTVAALRHTVDSLRADTAARIVETERPLSRWQQAKMDLGGIAIGAAAAALCIAVVLLIQKLRR